MKRIFLLSALFLCNYFAEANVRLPKIFGEGMVLQRNQAIPVWGWADKGELVSVQFHDQAIVTKADKFGKTITLKIKFSDFPIIHKRK